MGKTESFNLSKISVLTPSFNSSAYIEPCIQSVLAQNYTDFEHIIVDGGSEDGTVDILKKYPHLTWISEPDKGQSDAMNKAFKMSTGTVISYLNADDTYLPGAFDYVDGYFKNPDTKDILLGNLLHNYTGSTLRHSPNADIYSLLNYKGFSFPINPACYFYKRFVQEAIGDFPIDNHYTMDYWFLLRAFHKFSVEKVDFDFGYFMYHEGQKSGYEALSKNSMINDKKEFLKNKPFLKLWDFLHK